MDRESFVFYKSFLDGISCLPEKEDRADAYEAIIKYALTGEYPDIDGVALALFLMAKPQIDANATRYLNGKKGGRPKNESEKPMVSKSDECEKPMVSESDECEKPMVIENKESKKSNRNQTETEQEPNVNVNDNDNDNVNDNVNYNVINNNSHCVGNGGMGEEPKQEHPESHSDHSTGKVCPDHPPREKKHEYGQYHHVRLTQKELETLKRDYGDHQADAAVTFLDEYIEMKGYKAKSHYLAIRKWVFDAVREQDQRKRRLSQAPPGNYAAPKAQGTKFSNFTQRPDTDYDEIQKRLLADT